MTLHVECSQCGVQTEFIIQGTAGGEIAPTQYQLEQYGWYKKGPYFFCSVKCMNQYNRLNK